MIYNSRTHFGRVTIFIHWVLAVIVVGQFVFGLYMVSLDYYDPRYHSLPFYHKSVGILLALLLVFRIFWAATNQRPVPVQGVKPWEHCLSVVVQWSMNLLLLLVVSMGYLISTATGDSISVFGWFEVPATLTSLDNQEEWAGDMHYWLAMLVMAFAGLHVLAAFKHHFIDRDDTLRRMIRLKPVNTTDAE